MPEQLFSYDNFKSFPEMGCWEKSQGDASFTHSSATSKSNPFYMQKQFLDLFNMAKGSHNWCDQIGRFFKVLGDKFSCIGTTKILVTFWTILKNIILKVKTAADSFG